MGSALKIQRGGEEAKVTYARYTYTTSYSDQRATNASRAFNANGSSVVYTARGHYLDQTRCLFSMDFDQITASAYNSNLYKSFSLASPVSTNNRTGYFTSVYEYYTTRAEGSSRYTYGYLHTILTRYTVGSLIGYVSGKIGEYPTDGPHSDGYYYKLLITSDS